MSNLTFVLGGRLSKPCVKVEDSSRLEINGPKNWHWKSFWLFLSEFLATHMLSRPQTLPSNLLHHAEHAPDQPEDSSSLQSLLGGWQGSTWKQAERTQVCCLRPALLHLNSCEDSRIAKALSLNWIPSALSSNYLNIIFSQPRLIRLAFNSSWICMFLRWSDDWGIL